MNQDRPNHDPNTPPGPEPIAAPGWNQPSAPPIDLTFDGDCSPEFAGSVSVSLSDDHHLALAAAVPGRGITLGLLTLEIPENGIPGAEPAILPIPGRRLSETPAVLLIDYTNPEAWMNRRRGSLGVGGTVIVRAFDLASGHVDVEFQQVVLRSRVRGDCTVNGHLETLEDFHGEIERVGGSTP